MEKVLALLKKYFFITFVLSIILMVGPVVSAIKSNTIPTIDFIYIIKLIFIILGLTIIFIPVIAMLDLFIVQSSKALFKDYKNADRNGRVLIIVVFIILLLRKIVIWSR